MKPLPQRPKPKPIPWRPICLVLGALGFGLVSWMTWWTLDIGRVRWRDWWPILAIGAVTVLALWVGLERRLFRALLVVALVADVAGVWLFNRRTAQKLAAVEERHAQQTQQMFELAKVCSGVGVPHAASFVEGDARAQGFAFMHTHSLRPIIVLPAPWAPAPVESVAVVLCVRYTTTTVGHCPYIVPGRPASSHMNPLTKRQVYVPSTPDVRTTAPRTKTAIDATLYEARTGSVLDRELHPGHEPHPCEAIPPRSASSPRYELPGPTFDDMLRRFEPWTRGQRVTPSP